MNISITSNSHQNQLIEGLQAVERLRETLQLLELADEQIEAEHYCRVQILLQTSITRLENDADILKVLLHKLIS